MLFFADVVGERVAYRKDPVDGQIQSLPNAQKIDKYPYERSYESGCGDKQEKVRS